MDEMLFRGVFFLLFLHGVVLCCRQEMCTCELETCEMKIYRSFTASFTGYTDEYYECIAIVSSMSDVVLFLSASILCCAVLSFQPGRHCWKLFCFSGNSDRRTCALSNPAQKFQLFCCGAPQTTTSQNLRRPSFLQPMVNSSKAFSNQNDKTTQQQTLFITIIPTQVHNYQHHTSNKQNTKK